MVLVDLPGVQRPRDTLTERMAGRVRQELEGSDVALLMLNGEQGVGPGDRFIAAALVDASSLVTVAVNKIDRLDRAATVAVLQQAAELEVGEEAVSDLGPHRQGGAGARRASCGADARGSVHVLPAEVSDQPREPAAGRAGARGGHQTHVPGGAPRR